MYIQLYTIHRIYQVYIPNIAGRNIKINHKVHEGHKEKPDKQYMAVPGALRG